MNNFIPKKMIDRSVLQQMHRPNELERIELKYDKLLYHPPSNQIVLVMSTNNKSIAFPLSEFEGAMASFIFLGCSINAHIKTIHQMYLGLLKECGSTIECSVIEAMHGDIYYATIEYSDKKGRRFRNIASFADAIFLATLSGAKTYILRKVEEEAEDFSEWTYLQEIVDMSDDED